MGDSEGEKVQESSERPSMNSGQDSGIDSCKGLSNDENGSAQGNQKSLSSEGKTNQYVTSTPKKEFRFPGIMADRAILPSKMILDDPLLSSIDDAGDLTEHQVDSLASDDDCEDVSTQLYNTKVKVDLDSQSKRNSILSRFMDDVSAKPKMTRSRSFSGPLKSATADEPDVDSVKKNLFDIPVSPKLKSRVRQRLYTLVNSIEGYKGKVSIEEEEERKKLYHSKTFGSGLDLQNGVLKEGTHVYKDFHMSRSNESYPGLKIPLSRDANYNCHCNQQKHEEVSIQDKQGHALCLNQSHISSLNNTISERYGNAMSTMLETQLRQLHLHQEQLNQEKLRFALEKKDEEANARISLYRDKLTEMVQVVEELESKMRDLEMKKGKEIRVYEDKLRYQEERHKEALSLLHLECEKKVHEAENRVSAAREEATKNFDTKIMDLLSENRKRVELVEKEHQTHIMQMNAVISKLRAEKRETELFLEKRNPKQENEQLISNLEEISKEKDALRHEVEELRNRLKPANDIERRISEQEECISTLQLEKRKQEEEIKIWKAESEKWQKKFYSLEADQKRMLDKALQELQMLSEKETEKIQKENNEERKRMNEMIVLLQEKLSEALTKSAAFEQQRNQLRNIHKQQKEYVSSIQALEKEVINLNAKLEESDYTIRQEKKTLQRLQQRHAEEIVELQMHHKQEILKHQMTLEKERSFAVSEALTRRQEETRTLLSEMERRYQELLESVQQYSQAQIEEYKKAVRILKQKLKQSGEGEST